MDQESDPCPPALASRFLTTGSPGKSGARVSNQWLPLSETSEFCMYSPLGVIAGEQLKTLELCLCSSCHSVSHFPVVSS